MNDIKLIGVGGYARAGKDLFVKIASKILTENGYKTKKFAFADALKNDLDPWLKEKYDISAWTMDDIEKTLIRPFMVAHGCAKRNQTQGKYWVDKVHDLIETYLMVQEHELKNDVSKSVLFVSDVRFPNEADWVHSLGGKVVHLKKFSVVTQRTEKYNHAMSYGMINVDCPPYRLYSDAPNDEERVNDPLLQEKSDIFLSLEDVRARDENKGNIITEEELLTDSYLNEEITLCLSKFPFLNFQTR